MARNALIGTGFIGSILMKQRDFDEIYNSKNIEKMSRKEFGDVWCAGLPGTKWLANAHPSGDSEACDKLADVLRTINAKRFILISTVDVLGSPASGDESKEPKPTCDYGRNRLYFEEQIRLYFPERLIVRLPGIVGGNPTKGPLFDLNRNHQVEKLNMNSLYQWYPAKHLVEDCEGAWQQGIRFLHLVTPPISMFELCLDILDFDYLPEMKGKLQTYDVKTRYSDTNYTRDFPADELREYFNL